MSLIYRLGFCLGGVLMAGCALPKMNSDYDPLAVGGANGAGAGGKAPVGGSSAGVAATAAGSKSGSGGANSAGGSTSNGGTSVAGQSATLGGSPASGGSLTMGGTGGTSVTSGGTVASGGTSSAGSGVTSGGTNSTGGLSTVAGNKATGGATSTGGTASVAGATNRGGGSSTGGGTSTGGSASIGGVTSTAGTTGIAGSNGKLTAIAIAAGWNHTCAILSDKTVSCWGSKCDGRLGDGGVLANCPPGTNVISTTPIHVIGIATATAIAGGEYHTCAIASGGVKCWGYNGYGQLGDGSEVTSSAPVDTGITAAKAIVAGAQHSCALLENGSVQCWGQNSSSIGQLGNGTLEDSMRPVAVVITLTPPTPLTGVTSLASTEDHTCATTLNGDVYCWGDNQQRQMGNESLDQYSAIAVKATLVAQAGAVGNTISAGEQFSCALFADGLARCWGTGGYYAPTTSESPVLIAFSPASTKPLELAAGGSTVCAILPNASRPAQCWGYNYYGQVGDGTNISPRLAPVDVNTGSGASATKLTQIQSLSVGYYHSCAIVAGGAVYCWGRNDVGQLGTGNTNDSSTAKLVTGF